MIVLAAVGVVAVAATAPTPGAVYSAVETFADSLPVVLSPPFISTKPVSIFLLPGAICFALLPSPRKDVALGPVTTVGEFTVAVKGAAVAPCCCSSLLWRCVCLSCVWVFS